LVETKPVPANPQLTGEAVESDRTIELPVAVAVSDLDGELVKEPEPPGPQDASSSQDHPEPVPLVAPAIVPAQPALQPVLEKPPVSLPPYLISPAPASRQDGEIHMITVVLRSTGDKTRDVLRLRRIHGIITSDPGEDRFGFHVFERGRGYLLEFPNFTAGLCPELLTRLSALVGSDNVHVESITFH
jgi:hypothetical protein